VNYRLSPRVVFPAYIDDAAASVAWTYQNIDQYGGDPAKIFVSGHSAGGYLAAMLGMDPEYLNKYGVEVENIAGFIPVSGQMITHDAVRKERGIPETTPVIDEAAPVFYARRNVPPFLNICGGNDLPARAEENRYFVAALKAAGDRQVEYLEFEGRDHLSILGQLTESDDEVAQAMLAFIFGTQETSVDLWALH
jgi:acetyl esterase/lipase